MITTFTKQSTETYIIAFEYFGKMPFRATLVSATVSAIDISDDSDASSIVLSSETATIVKAQARVRVKAGTSGKSYKITSAATLSDGSVLEDEAIMEVENV